LTKTVEALAPAGVSSSLSSVAFKLIEESNATRSRSFWWRVEEMTTVSPIVSSRINIGVTLTVAYAFGRSTQRTDSDIVIDYNAITDAILNEQNWNRPASSIVALSQGGAEIMAATVRDSDNMRYLDLGFEIQVST